MCLQGKTENKLLTENKHLKGFDLQRIRIVRGRLSLWKYGRSFSVFVLFLQIETGLKSLSTIIIN